MSYKFLNLQLFGEEGAAETGEVAAPTTAEGVEGVATGDTGEQAAPAEETFDSLIQGKYKKDYDKAVKTAIQKRFKNQADLQGQIDIINPIIQQMAERYGVQAGQDGKIDVQALQRALDADNSMYEKEAFDRGMSIDDLRHMKQIERENAQLKQQSQRSEQQREWDALMAQGDALKETYPEFDMDTEMQDPKFGRLLATLQKSGFKDAVKTAYETVHKDEIMGGAMRYAVAQTEKKISNSIASGTRRPAENGTAAGAPAAVTSLDPSKLTKAQIEEIKMRALRGERVTF